MSQSNQFLAIAQVCKILSAAAATREESESFANFASKWDEYAAARVLKHPARATYWASVSGSRQGRRPAHQVTDTALTWGFTEPLGSPANRWKNWWAQ